MTNASELSSGGGMLGVRRLSPVGASSSIWGKTTSARRKHSSEKYNSLSVKVIYENRGFHYVTNILTYDQLMNWSNMIRYVLS